MQLEIMLYIADICGAAIGQLSENGGLTLQLAPSSAGTVYLDGSSSDNMSLLFLCKQSDQRTALEILENLCNRITRIKHHPHGIYSVKVASQPNYIGKEGGCWIYSCVIDLKYYNKEDF